MSEKSMTLAIPEKGKASSYSNYFVGKHTSSGQIYSHQEFTAAILPRQRRSKVRLGTMVKITHSGRAVVVKINDRGAGNGTVDRVLDLSRTAMSQLVGWLGDFFGFGRLSCWRYLLRQD